MVALEIKPHNIPAHLDVEEDIKKSDGQMTFTLRVNAGNIVDYQKTEYVDARKKYGIIKSVVVEELSLSYDHGTGS